MEGRSRELQRNGGTAKRLKTRLVSFGVLAFSLMMLLAACGPNVDKPYSTTSPASDSADDVQGLYKIIFWLSLIVFVGVNFALVYLSLRYRSRKSRQDRPPQIHGNKRLELIWTIIPAIVLLVLLIPTITTLYDHAAQAEDPDLVVDVYGKQWWWEFHYGEADAQNGENLGVITANEIVVPVDTNIVFNLHSNNVIHSFWVPQLSGKLDVVPGHINTLSITPREVGEYYGECAEYCGAQHAWMRFKITVVSQEEFYNYVNNWRQSPQTSASQTGNPNIVQAPQIFSVCLSCHSVNGSDGPPLPTGIDAPANMGPNLTMVGCRETIAAGMLENNPENMALWLRDPNAVKPDNTMATTIGPDGTVQLTDEQIDELVDYLYNDLTPQNGCTVSDGWGSGSGTPVASPVANPQATPVD